MVESGSWSSSGGKRGREAGVGSVATGFLRAPVVAFSLCPWWWEWKGFPAASGRGGGRFPRSIWIGHAPTPIVKPGYPVRASTHFPGRLSEMMWKVGSFKCEVGRSHTPDLAAPFLFFAGSSESQRAVLPSVWVSRLPWAAPAVAKAFKDTH